MPMITRIEARRDLLHNPYFPLAPGAFCGTSSSQPAPFIKEIKYSRSSTASLSFLPGSRTVRIGNVRL